MKKLLTSPYQVLIVEDEVLIADSIQRYVESAGHTVVGTAISYEEGTELYDQTQPDLVLIDIRLNGPKTGIDVATYIQELELPVPFIFLTAQTDSYHLDLAKKTFPSGFLSKPLQKGSLIATIEVVMHKFLTEQARQAKLIIKDGSKKHLISTASILFLRSEHVYVRIFLEDGGTVLQRASLKDMLGQLPGEDFLQTHRSFAVNKWKVTNWNSDAVFIEEEEIPVSRGKRKEIFTALQERK